MDLWVRSQDKTELVKIEEVCIHIDEDGFIGIWSYGSNKNLKYYLGNYSTKERALEVLDEIQRLITDLQYLSYGIENDKFCSYRPNVYEMPEE